MYASSDDLRSHLGELYISLYQRTDGTLDTVAVEDDLAAAAGEVNAFVSVRYVTPLSSELASMPLIKSWVLFLASALAWGRSGKEELPKYVALRVSEIRQCLREISSGTMVLPGATEVKDDVMTGMTLLAGSPVVFTREKMEVY